MVARLPLGAKTTSNSRGEQEHKENNKSRSLNVAIAKIVADMPEAHRKFLVSSERGEPDWKVLGTPAAADLPAVKWRQLHLDKLTKDRRAALVAQLEEVLGV
jgi:hypothetical protein